MSKVQEAAFGELVTAIRRDKKLRQEELARRVSEIRRGHVAASTISRIEQGAISISSALGLLIIDALDPGPTARKRLREALDVYIEQFDLPAPYEGSGALFGQILDELRMSQTEMARVVGKTPQAMQAWRAGIGLVADETLTIVLDEFRKKGVGRSRLLELARAHAVDVIMTMKRLTYLSQSQRKQLADCAARLIKSPPTQTRPK